MIKVFFVKFSCVSGHTLDFNLLSVGILNLSSRGVLHGSLHTT